jgi:teichuronic acid biosynthesis glycosyltransferase TuaC
VRVLIIAKDFPAPGQPRGGIFVLRQAQALAELGHEIRIVRIVPHAPPWTPKWRSYRAVPTRYTIEGIAVHSIRAFFPPRMLAMEYLPLQLDGAIRRVIADFAPHVLHAHFLIPSGQLAVRQGPPTIVTAHGSDAYDWAWRRPGLKRAAAEAIARAEAVVAVSRFIERRVRDLAECDVRVIYNGADERIFGRSAQSAARESLGIAADRFVVVFTGGDARGKGLHDLIEAAGRLGEPRLLLLATGLETPFDAIRAAVASAGVEARLFGVIEQSEIARLLAAADVFTLPSYNEGLPASICEAMLSARPILATPVGGIPEVAVDGVHGYLVAPGDVASLAERLRELARDPGAGVRMGEAGYRFAREHLTWRVNARRYDEVYRGALGATG